MKLALIIDSRETLSFLPALSYFNNWILGTGRVYFRRVGEEQIQGNEMISKANFIYTKEKTVIVT